MILSGNPIDYLWAFLGGVLASLTPCVYPLIPVTIAVLGIDSVGSRRKGLILGLVYVTGIAVTYSALGLFASFTGQLFGTISSSPAAYFIVGAAVVLFSISMLDVFPINLPVFMRLPQLKKKNYLSVFVFGLISGLIVGPCLTPVLGSILALLIVKKSILYGMSLLFVFAYGMGFVLILAAALSGAIINLPKPGKWLVWIKKIFALMLLVIGAYLITRGIRRM